ncbi:MAG: DNA cytosine methyltransferase [Desulfurococcales archaeon]|nr:DNA cytosine methyltransferase [Desulfurococcales archaeon]
MKKSSFLTVDLFSGAGGFSIGFEEAGFQIALAVDQDKAAAKTYAGNFPHTLTINEDLRNLTCKDIRYLLGRKNVEVVIGSPPCEPYTGANPRRKKNPLDRLYTDPEGGLVLEFIRVVDCLKPKIFVMENVPALIEDGLKNAIKWEFRKAGYEVFFNILRAEDYGTPSRRVRVFASNIKLRPEKSREKVKVKDAISGLPPPSPDPDIPNHDIPPNLSKSKLKRVHRLRWGESLIKYEGAGRKQLPNYIRLHPHKVAPTVLGSSRFIHPYEPRLLTVREQARLMGFPDNHVFLGGKDQQYNQVGEAVPPPLSKAIGDFVMRWLRND